MVLVNLKMDLRALLNTVLSVFLFFCWGVKNSYAHTSKKNIPLIPYEIKFADVTFQLNDVTRYLIQTELKSIQANKQQIQNQLDQFSLFLPIVEPILKQQGVPDDFKFLVVYNKYQSSIEKSINLENGVFWCLDKQKAEDVDLLMNVQLDERKHLIASTKGAAMCLKRNQVLYRNWGSTLFSHISDKKILSLLEINKKWAENAFVLLDSPAYTAILQFLAYKIAIEKEFPAYKPSQPKILYEYPYSVGKTLNRIAVDLKVEPEVLQEYNQWLIVQKVPDTECHVLVVVPTNRYNEVRTFAELSRKTGLPTKDLGFPVLKRDEKINKTKVKGGVFYLINDIEGIQAEMCDIVVTMAYKAGISIEKFVEYNDMKENDLLRVGQVYYIQKKASKASVPFHVVREGETLWDISQTYGVRLDNLLEFNRFETVQRLQRGRIIWLQTTRPKNKPIEYIEMPDELTEIEDFMQTEQANLPTKVFVDSSQVLSESKLNIEDSKIQQKKSVKNDDLLINKDLSKEIENNSPPLVKEIRKEQSKSINLPKKLEDKTENSSLKPEDELAEYQKRQQSITVEKSNQNEVFVSHTVKKGETLFRISVNYNVSIDDLWSLNDLSSTIVKVGTVLKIKR
ncbi:hypothetical protein EMA8858_01370 [Emticicia aquatica]|uniref:LysM domain-containing protein n=2 Tax=Emticicia aquatica TaxID=1681835 RepID=A0ABM9AN49_9BACT|nr:hypothetical protein EMA8858_01370 [Emticicia aquatica]